MGSLGCLFGCYGYYGMVTWVIGCGVGGALVVCLVVTAIVGWSLGL